MQNLVAVLERARERSRELGRAVYAFHTEPVDPIDPLEALGYEAPQMYWTSPDRLLTLAGIGAVAVIRSHGRQSAFDAVRSWWAEVSDAVVGSDPEATRPVMMGGFAFDPGAPASEAWEPFGAASFCIPRVLVARRGDACTLTLAASVHDAVDAGSTVTELLAWREAALAGSAPVPPAFSVDTSMTSVPMTAEWRQMLEHAVRDIRAGRLRKVVLARSEHAVLDPIDVRAALRHLRDNQPGTFVYGVWRDDAVFLGASPELLARVDGRAVRTSVLAGSAPRGWDDAADRSRMQSLAASTKDRDEHEIVRRDIAETLGAICEDVRFTDPELVTLPNVHHLHTRVDARLLPGRSIFDAIAALHPTPAVGGAPREAALQFIRRHESLDRGWYAGPVGWTDGERGEFAVALRCALVRGDAAQLFAGCGIVAQSDPQAEWEESQIKLRPAVEALSAGIAEATAATLTPGR